MNPAISMSYAEVGLWLENLATSHAKREHPAVEAHLEMSDDREGRSYGLRLVLGERSHPPAGSPPIEVDAREAAEGRTRFAWCQAMGERIRTDVRRVLLAGDPPRRGQAGGLSE